MKIGDNIICINGYVRVGDKILTYNKYYKIYRLYGWGIVIYNDNGFPMNIYFSIEKYYINSNDLVFDQYFMTIRQCNLKLILE